MKIYTRVVMDMTQDDLPVIESESFEYDGPVALCWGGVGRDGHDGREGGGGSFGNDSSHGAGPSGLGGGLGGDGLGGNSGGWGNSPHGNPDGTLGPSFDNYHGVSGGLSAPNAHGGMAGLGLSGTTTESRGVYSPQEQRDFLNNVSREQMRDIEYANIASSLDNPMGPRDHLANMWEGAKIFGRMMGAMMAGPVAMGIQGYQEFGRIQDIASLRDPNRAMPETQGWSMDGNSMFGSGTEPYLPFEPQAPDLETAEAPKVTDEMLESLGSLDGEDSPMAAALDSGWELGMQGATGRAVRKAVESIMNRRDGRVGQDKAGTPGRGATSMKDGRTKSTGSGYGLQ